MKLPVIGACTALLLQTMSAQPMQQPAAMRGSIEGIVVRAGTGQPIPGARVTLGGTAYSNEPASQVASPGIAGIRIAACTPGTASVTGAGAPTVTDGQGRFIFKDLDPSTYCVAAGANGYAKQAYGQRAASGQGLPIKLNSGQAIRDIVVPLSPAGNISGRIRDSSGQPATGIQVQLLKSAYNANGQRLFQSAGTARTDDRGEYRLYWVSPGRYFVLAGIAIPGVAGAAVGSPNEIPGDAFQPTFYPNAMDVSQASGIEVKPASDIGGVDFLLSRQPPYRIRGRVIDGRTGQVPPSVNITLVTVSATGGTNNQTSGSSYNTRDGTFELKDVSSGFHVVRVQTSINNTVTPGNSGIASTLATLPGTAQVTLNVNSDVEGVVLTIANGVSLPGQLTMDGQASFTGIERIRVQMRPSLDGVIVSNIGGPTPIVQTISANGVFRIDSIMAGEYRFVVGSLPPDSYITQARFNQVDILNKPMQFTSSETGTVEIVLSSKGGQLDGIVLDDRQRPVQGIEAVMIPDRPRDRLDLYKTALTDASGRFSIRGIAPGDYHVFAWEAMDQYAYFDPDVLKQDEQNGKAIHFAEGSREVVDVRLIPAP